VLLASGIALGYAATILWRGSLRATAKPRSAEGASTPSAGLNPPRAAATRTAAPSGAARPQATLRPARRKRSPSSTAPAPAH
jgi:hypothetical protein